MRSKPSKLSKKRINCGEYSVLLGKKLGSGCTMSVYAVKGHPDKILKRGNLGQIATEYALYHALAKHRKAKHVPKVYGISKGSAWLLCEKVKVLGDGCSNYGDLVPYKRKPHHLPHSFELSDDHDANYGERKNGTHVVIDFGDYNIAENMLDYYGISPEEVYYPTYQRITGE